MEFVSIDFRLWDSVRFVRCMQMPEADGEFGLTKAIAAFILKKAEVPTFVHERLSACILYGAIERFGLSFE